jgi:probable addiction module antidote protein
MTGKRMSSASRDHEAATIESIRKDPKFAAEYLNTVLEDGEQEELMIALGRIAAAYGGVPKLAESAKLNATTLYRTLSRKGNPELRSMSALLKAMGLRLAVQPIRISVREQRSRNS